MLDQSLREQPQCGVGFGKDVAMDVESDASSSSGAGGYHELIRGRHQIPAAPASASSLAISTSLNGAYQSMS
jgi:hypothetical protein